MLLFGHVTILSLNLGLFSAKGFVYAHVMAKALFLSPMIPSYDASVTTKFFHELLGFKIVMQEDGYAVLEKDSTSVHLLPAGEDIGQMEIYLETDDVDAIWVAMKDNLSGIKHKAPFDRPYGMREIHVEVPETKCLMFIGQSLK